MRPVTITAIALLLAGLAAPVTPAAAFNCELPGVLDPAKRTVCRHTKLRQLNAAEKKALHATSAKLGITSIGAMRADRDHFLKARKACRRDVRCHEATYTAQIRLYDEIAAACQSRESDQYECTNGVTARHREALHQSR